VIGSFQVAFVANAWEQRGRRARRGRRVLAQRRVWQAAQRGAAAGWPLPRHGDPAAALAAAAGAAQGCAASGAAAWASRA